MAANTSMLSLMIYRSLRLRFQQVFVVFAALCVGAAIITAMAGVYFDINTKMSQELRTFGANFFIGPGKEGELKQAQYQSIINKIPEKDLVAQSPYLYGVARLELEKVVLMGVDFSQFQKLSPYWQVDGQWIGVSFDTRNALIGKTLAKRLELKVGDSVVLTQNNHKHSLKIKGIIESGEASDNYLIVNLSLAQQWLNKPSLLNYAMLSIDNDHHQVTDIAKNLQQQFPQLEIRPIRKISASEGKVLNKIKGLMGVVAFVILVLSTLCVNTTLTAMIQERRYEIALQKALGATHKSIRQQILIETIVIALVAILVGLVLGYVLAQLLGHAVFHSSIDLRIQVLPITLILSLGAAFIAAIIPTRQTSTIQPASVLKGE
ncbi:FtsX-like permease family protein [Vibrio sp.]|nr:FtsX-like permease family protein [Vibrio sp.]